MIEAGKKYGRLTAVRRVKNRNRNPYWEFNCDCGNLGHVTQARHVFLGRVNGCGCIKHDTRTALKHGGKGSKLYSIWKGMRKRCYGRDPHHARYREIGISVAQEWGDFAVFRDWAFEAGYRDGLEIDRIDNDGDYSPKNCRWATRVRQMLNTSRTRMVEFRGHTVPAADLANIVNMKCGTLYRRLRCGWDIETALFTPPGQARRVEVAD